MPSPHVCRNAKDIVKSSKAMLGPGWNHVSAEIRESIALAHVLTVMLSQDESIKAETILKTTREIADEVRRILNEENKP